MSTRELCLQCTSTRKIQLSVLIWYNAGIITISLIANCSHCDIAEALPI